MFYITGDTHGDFSRYIEFTKLAEPTQADTMIVLGDAGLNYFCNEKDESRKQFVNSFPFTTFCIHGNHEKRPYEIPSYRTREYCGGTVWYEEAYPKIIFAKDGEIYTFDGLRCLVIGGAYSVDKFYRLRKGWAWFDSEQPSPAIKKDVEIQLEACGRQVDVVLSHTCPLHYEPVEAFLHGLDPGTIDQSTEEWLDRIEAKLSYRRWYCGHFHIRKSIDKMRFLFDDIDTLRV